MFIVKKRVLILILGVLLLIPSFFGLIKTRVNYDLLTYLPGEVTSVQGEHILDRVFSDAATGLLVIKGMPDKDAARIKDRLAAVGGVERVVWKNDIADITVPDQILPESVSDVFTRGDSTLMLIQFKNSASSAETQQAIGRIRGQLNTQCFLSGSSALVKDTVELANRETPRYALLAVLLALLVMSLTIDSWLVPLLFLTSIGMAIIYNLGSNIFFGQISYITKALAAALQIGVTMDFAIFLYSRYVRELRKNPDQEEAMAAALSHSFTAVFGSGLATTCGFLALGVMKLGLGRDIGFVMAKGVFLSVICTFTILPSLLLVLKVGSAKFTHRTLMPSFDKLASWVVDKRWLQLIIGLIILVPAWYGQKNVQLYYNLEQSLPGNMPSIVSLNVLKKDFNMATTHMVLVHDSVPAYQLARMADDISSLPGVTKVISVDQLAGPGIPSTMLPESVREMFERDGYKIVLVNSRYAAASDQMKTQLRQMGVVVRDYDPRGMITGEGALTNDLIDISNTDFNNVSTISIAVVFGVIMLLFTSLTLPIVLVCTIELAIFINMSIPYYTGSVIPFIASIVVGCIQLAATVDYAILLASSFREHLRHGEKSDEAMRNAVRHSTRAIVTSALTFFAATFSVYLVSRISLLKSLTLLISRGAVISMLIIIFVLPAVLLLSEKVIEKTSLFWNNRGGGAAVPINTEEID